MSITIQWNPKDFVVNILIFLFGLFLVFESIRISNYFLAVIGTFISAVQVKLK